MKFRKIPVEVEAMLVTANNIAECAAFCNGTVSQQRDRVTMSTFGDSIHAELGDWIIKGVKGEFYPCKPDIFDATYEPIY